MRPAIIEEAATRVLVAVAARHHGQDVSLPAPWFYPGVLESRDPVIARLRALASDDLRSGVLARGYLLHDVRGNAALTTVDLPWTSWALDFRQPLR